MNENPVPGRSWSLAAVWVLLVALVPVAGTEASTVQGTFTYGGGSVSDSFPGIQAATAAAIKYPENQWAFGTVDLASGTFQIDGLEAGEYWVLVQLSPVSSMEPNVPRSNELFAGFYVTLTEEETVTRALELKVAVHYTQPYDSLAQLSGSVADCPLGPSAPDTFTLAWDAIPLATSYVVRVERWDCPRTIVGTSVSTVFTTSAEVTQGVAEGEKYIRVYIVAYDDASLVLSDHPYITYDNGFQSSAFYLHLDETSARPLHPSSSRFVVQVAHAPGQPPTFWMSDLILTNPTSSDITATIRYTPRGADGTESWVEATVLVPAGASTVYPDVVSSLLGASGAGSLEVAGSLSLEVMTRTYTPAPGGGTYGQGYAGVGAEAVASAAGTHTRLGAGGVTGGDFRSNLALAETWGEQAEVVVTLRDGTGDELGSKGYTVEPFSSIQINDVIAELGGPADLTGGHVEVEVTGGNGRVAGILSVADQTTDDPTAIMLTPR